MTEEESKKHHWLRLAAIALMVFIIAFLAFYVALEIMLNRVTDPMYNAKRIEKIVQHQQRDLSKFEEKMMENPFEPKMRPMIVNLVKENSEYIITVDLKPLDGNSDAVNIGLNDNILTISGELDKNLHGNEKIVKFTQSYYLDEKLEFEKMAKDKKGNKLIVTIPFLD